MISVRSVLRQVPDPRGKQGLQHPLEALLGLILLSMLSGRKGMRAAFRLGRSLSRRQLNLLGFRRNVSSPCHATFTETLRILDPDALAEASSPPINKGARKVKLRTVSFRSMARPFAAARTQVAMPNMSCRLSARRLGNLLVTVLHEGKAWKYQTRCVCWKRSILKA